MNSTLLLNTTSVPVSLIPLSSIQWSDACRFIYTEQATVLHEYDNWIVHSEKLQYKIPAVMILNNPVKIKRKLKCEDDINNAPSSQFLFLRDNNTCAYCMKKFPSSQLTVDHVVPKSKNGKTVWNNVVSSCSPCNGNRGNNTKIQPRYKPFRPTYALLTKNLMKQPIIIPHISWSYYLNWPEHLINIVPPERNLNHEKSFLNDKRIKILNV